MAVSTWSACTEQVGTVIRRRRGAETQALSQPAGAFQSRETHIINREPRQTPSPVYVLSSWLHDRTALPFLHTLCYSA